MYTQPTDCIEREIARAGLNDRVAMVTNSVLACKQLERKNETKTPVGRSQRRRLWSERRESTVGDTQSNGFFCTLGLSRQRKDRVWATKGGPMLFHQRKDT